MKQIAAAAIATALTLGAATAGAAQTGATHAQPATQHAMHATTAAQAHTTAATAHVSTTHRGSTHISESRARRAALGAVAHGRVKSHWFTHVNGKRAYVYVLAVPGRSGTQRVTVDATTGAVVPNEHRAAAGAAHTNRTAPHTHTAAAAHTAAHHRR
jgi:uncharacterized membrane protein YkoI